ncbi:unnamed protein product [Amoebophrya sp. A25]|nr:unnamed protein product [Amoebophrya sp. A25]|eukprot:GSA25T00002540001.1
MPEKVVLDGRSPMHALGKKPIMTSIPILMALMLNGLQKKLLRQWQQHAATFIKFRRLMSRQGNAICSPRVLLVR